MSARRSRFTTWRWWLVIVAALATAVVIKVTATPESSTIVFAPNNPSGDGAQALAAVLHRQGVDIDFVRSPAQAVAAAGGSAEDGVTVLVAAGSILDEDQAGQLAGIADRLVLISAGQSALDALAPGLVAQPGDLAAADSAAACQDPDAAAAGTLTGSGALIAVGPQAGSHWVSCFPADDGAAFGMVRSASADSGGAADVVVLAGYQAFTNASITQAGNAALALRALGAHQRLVWLVPDAALVSDSGGTVDSLAPGWLQPLLWAMLAGFGALVWWRWPRFGPLVAESLPVTVRSEEVTEGRARLYRRGNDVAHAAALLRADAAQRLADRVGADSATPPHVLVDLVAAATATPPERIASLLYGPPPRSLHDLGALEADLDALAATTQRQET